MPIGDRGPAYPPEFDLPDKCVNCGKPAVDHETLDELWEGDFCSEACERCYATGRYAEVGVDTADGYLGSGDDGVYWQVAEGPDGWYVSTLVDCDTGGFVGELRRDDGPYPTREEADAAGREAAQCWCIDNQVAMEE